MNVSKLDTRGWPTGWPRATRWPRARAIEQIKAFGERTAEVAFSNPTDGAARRSFIATVLRRYRYCQLSKGPRGVLFVYMQRLTGYSRQHLSKLIAQYRDTPSVKPRKRVSRSMQPLAVQYVGLAPRDILDVAHVHQQNREAA